MYPISLGDLIENLETMCSHGHGDLPLLRKYDQDIGKLHWGEPCSWRGSYSELTLPSGDNEYTVREFLDMLRSDVLNKMFYGYKGGEFTMYESVDVWSDSYGSFSETGVADVFEENGNVYVLIRQFEY